jgi:hypothetical protein
MTATIKAAISPFAQAKTEFDSNPMHFLNVAFRTRGLSLVFRAGVLLCLTRPRSFRYCTRTFLVVRFRLAGVICCSNQFPFPEGVLRESRHRRASGSTGAAVDAMTFREFGI